MQVNPHKAADLLGCLVRVKAFARRRRTRHEKMNFVYKNKKLFIQMYKIIYDTQKSVKNIEFLLDCVKNCSKQQINSKKLLKKYKKGIDISDDLW